MSAMGRKQTDRLLVETCPQFSSLQITFWTRTDAVGRPSEPIAGLNFRFSIERRQVV